MRRITLILITVIMFSKAYSATGWFEDYIKLNINNNGVATPTGWYWIGGNPSYATELNNANLGVVSSLKIAGCDMKYWSDTQDRTGGAFYYKIMSSDGGTQIVSQIETVWTHTYLSGNNYQGTITVDIDLLTGLQSSRTYKLHIWAKSWGSGEGDSWLSNGGSNYVATFTTSTSPTDYFRSKSSGNWNTAGTWESSSDNSNWITSTLVPGSSAASITILNGHNITLNTNTSIPGLIINSGGTFTASDASARTLTITKSAPESSTTLANSGTWVNGTGGSTVVFTGAPSSGDAIHAITGTIPFQKVIVNKTGGSSNVGAGFAANCSVSQSLEIGNGGFVSTDPPASFYGSNAVLKFNQGISANYEINPGDKTWSTTIIPNSITINSGTVTVNENRTATGTLIVDNDANLVVNESKQLTIDTLTNNGTFTLKTGATALTTIVGGSGTTNVEQSLTSGRQWWYLSSPVSAATSDVFAPTLSENKIGTYVEDYLNDENEGTTAPYYTNPYAAGSSTALSVAKGYVVKLANTVGGTYTFTGGLLNNGNITIAPTRTGTANAKRGFNLIGNPYPSYIDWDLLYDRASATNMRNAIWFRTWNGTAMDFHTYSDGDGVPDQASGKIAPMQGFWVKVHADGSNGSLTFKNTHRSHYASGYNPLKVKTADDRQRVRLVLSDGTNSDETLIVGKSYASDSQDAYDIEKMSNESADISEIYSMIGTETMVINSVAPITAGKTVALGIRSTSEKAYSITASQLQNIPTDVRVILVDAEAETETELSEGLSYNFVASAGAVNNRFSIQFRSPGATTQVDNDSKNQILVYSNSQQQIEIISTESLPAGTQIRVFNAAGQNVAGVQAAGNHIHIPVALGKGVYFCHIENTNQNLQYKVIVR